MEKLDCLGWADGISFRSYGLRIGVRVSTPDALALVKECLPPGWKPASSMIVDHLYSLRVGGSGSYRGVRHFHQLYGGTTQLARTLNLDNVLHVLESDLNLLVAAEARQRIFVHAGVVGWHGQAIVIPGRSLSGKTTLVAALLRAGATYYSDEYAVLDSTGRVHPFPRPLSFRQESGERPKKIPARELDARTGVRALPVGLVAVTKHQPGARWRPRRLSPGQALLALLDNTVPARIRPDAVLPVLRQVVLRAPAVKGRRGEAEEVVDRLLRRCGSSGSA
jgi:hypothetical protein